MICLYWTGCLRNCEVVNVRVEGVVLLQLGRDRANLSRALNG